MYLHPATRRTAHTLLELVTALVASSMLLVGLGSVMVIGTRVAYTPAASSERLDAARTIDEIANELRFATFLLARSDRVLEFVVADRNSDGRAERIRYEWSGVVGDPLLKTVNENMPTPVLDAITNFAVSATIVRDESTLTTTSQSAETLLTSYTATASGTVRNINDTTFSAQRIAPATFAGVPANATGWNLTRVDFLARRNGSGETLRVQLCKAGAPYSRPSGELLGEVPILEDYLTSSLGWNTVTFSTPICNLALYRNYALVWRGTLGESSNAGSLATDDNAATGVNESNDGGATWSYYPARRTFFRIYGTYTVPSGSYTVARDSATRVNLDLQIGAAAHARASASVPLVNRPELLASYWRADFDANPTASDITRDGVNDWVMASNGIFSAAAMVEGVWFANGALETRPKNNFSTTTTINVRARNTSVGGNGAVVQIHADRQGGKHAPLAVRLQRQSDGSQTLTLLGRSDDSTEVALYQIANLGSGFIRYQLTILPAHNVVNLAIEGEDQGTFAYPTYTPTGDDRFLTFYSNTSSSEFDYVEVRVAE